MENHKTAILLLERNDWMTKIDLQDAYYAVPIRREDRKYLRFIYEDSEASVKYFETIRLYVCDLFGRRLTYE
ncbi:hypothetical protein TKK_0019006 [Trichogramma kaykai]